MKRIGILGDIGSGKTYIAKCFGFPVFNADLEVAKIYKHNRKVFQKLKKELPNYFDSFPVKKKEIINAILSNRKNLKRIIKIVHREVRKKMNDFLRTGKNLGCQVSNGKMMFIYQALEAFKLWHEVDPEINEELKKLLDL